MATAENKPRKKATVFTPDLDFIPTISSDEEEDVPNFDATLVYDEDDFDGSSPALDKVATNGKRKRNAADAEDASKSGRETKKQKTQKKKRSPTNGLNGLAEPENNFENEEDDEVDAVEDDWEFNPDFEFFDGANGDVSTGFDKDWDIPLGSKAQNSTAIGIDEIVKRRKQKHEQSTTDQVVADEDSLNENEDGFMGFQDDDEDEFFAEDGFGMGAKSEEDEEQEDSEPEVSEDDEPTLHSTHVNGESASDDDDEIAAPMPHPDDISDGDQDQGDQLTERQAAFFAPEEPTAKTKSLSLGPDSFQNMSLSRPILKGLSTIGFDTPTPIQTKTIPVALLGKDVVGGAVTGSGKTAAFIIPILERLLYRPKKVPTTRVSVLMPTRELAVQCYNVATRLASFTDISFALIVGGLSLREQEQTLRKRPDVVIATPGRFIDHMRNSASFVVEHLEILVLDEADRMLEDGFADELNEVLTTIPKSRQTMLFSATMTEDVDQLIRVGLNRPVRLMVDSKRQTVQGLTQEFIKMKAGKEVVDEERRLAYLLNLCATTYTSKTIIFFPRKALAHRVKVLFTVQGLKAAELHGSMSQEQRLNAISSFRDGSCTHLLATNLASRGLDIPRVETVINFTTPTSTTNYLHRVGRTARAGLSGVSCTLFAAESKSESKKESSKSERAHLRPILRLARNQGANIRTRTIPAPVIDDLTAKVRALDEEIESILLEEKEERLLQQTERDVTKGENLVKYEEEIASRPKRTWFQSEKEKKAASKLGKNERLGVEKSSAGKPKEKRKLSGKERKRLEDRDMRRDKGVGWKKGKKERSGKGDSKPSAKGKKKKEAARKGPKK